MQALAEVHDTAVSTLGFDRPPGVETGCSDHPDLFHRSANATGAAVRSTSRPTAKQAVADGHDTPLKCHPVDASGFAVR